MDLSPFLPGFIAAYAILLVGAASPGPSVAMLIGIATGEGRGPALIATLGIATGSATLNILTMLGVGLLLSQAAWAMSVMRLLGAAYLLYLAWGAFQKMVRPPQVQPLQIKRRSAWRYFLMGYLLQVSNPKAVAFWLAIASIGATTGGGPAVIALFIAGACAISFVCHGAWAVVMSAPPVRAAYAAARRWVEAGLGVFFVVAAYKLATSRL